MRSKLLVTGLIIMSLSYASLLNTTDQVLKNSNGLGGNPAVNAYNKVTGFEGGLTLLDSFSPAAGNHGDPVAYPGKISDKATDAGNIYLQYTHKLDAKQFVGVTFAKDGLTDDAFIEKVSGTKVEDKLSTNTKQVLSAKYGIDLTNKINGLFLGAEFAMVSDKYKVVETVAKTDASEDSSYNTLKVGGIYDINKTSKLTFAQAFNPMANKKTTGKVSGAKISDSDADADTFNDKVANITTLGGSTKLMNDKLELAGAVDMVATEKYIRDAGSLTEKEVNEIGYNQYTLAADYAVAKDMGVQGYFSWANGVDKFTTDKINSGDEFGKNTQTIGANVSKDFNNQKVIVGLAKISNTSADPDNKWKKDEVKLYVNYAYNF